MLTAQATALIPTAAGVPLLRSYAALTAAMESSLASFVVKQKACMETYPVTSFEAVSPSRLTHGLCPNIHNLEHTTTITSVQVTLDRSPSFDTYFATAESSNGLTNVTSVTAISRETSYLGAMLQFVDGGMSRRRFSSKHSEFLWDGCL